MIRVSDRVPEVSGVGGPALRSRKAMAMALEQSASISDIRSAIRELSLRADIARKEGREQDAAELERRAQAYREELSKRP